MKKRVEDGYPSPIDQDSDTSSLSSFSEIEPYQNTVAYDHPVDAQGYHCLASDNCDGLAFSGESISGDYKEGSTATSADAGEQNSTLLFSVCPGEWQSAQ